MDCPLPERGGASLGGSLGADSGQRNNIQMNIVNITLKIFYFCIPSLQVPVFSCQTLVNGEWNVIEGIGF